jgi:4-hydroxy-3-polyprenylbenzoate decarboxylase
MKLKIVIGVTGASGAIYAKDLLKKLDKYSQQIEHCAVVFTDQARLVWQHELGNDNPDDLKFRQYPNDSFFAPFASGSANYDVMIICPCSMGTLGRIAAGIANDLIARTADVMLKERRKLIIVPRETPYNLIHLKNMLELSQAGAIICPASPAFYNKPADIDDLVDTVTARILKLAGLNIDSFEWMEKDDNH